MDGQTSVKESANGNGNGQKLACGCPITPEEVKTAVWAVTGYGFTIFQCRKCKLVIGFDLAPERPPEPPPTVIPGRDF